MPQENFWTLWCKGRLTKADTPTIRLGATPSGLTSVHLHHPPIFTGRMPFLPPNQQCQSTEGNKLTKAKPKPKSPASFKNCSRVCVRIIVYYCSTQHRTVLIIFAIILQTIITAQMQSAGGQRQGRIKASAGPGAVPNAGAPYRPITAHKIFHCHQLRAPKTVGPDAAAPLAPPLMRHCP